MRRRPNKALGIPFLLLTLAAASGAVLGLAAGPAAAVTTTTTSCRIMTATGTEATGAVSGSVTKCGDTAVSGGGGTFTFTSNVNFSSAALSWQSGGTSELTGTVETFVNSTCVGSAASRHSGPGTVSYITGTVSGGNVFVGDTYGAFVCATPNSAATSVTYSLASGNEVAAALGERHVKSTFFVI